MKKKIYGVLIIMAMAVNVIACGPKESNISSNSGDVVGNEDIDNEDIDNEDIDDVPDITASDEAPTETEESESAVRVFYARFRP